MEDENAELEEAEMKEWSWKRMIMKIDRGG